jgi:hypothetical protein
VLVASEALECAAGNLEMTADILRLAVRSLKEDGVWGKFKPPRPYRMSKATHDLKVASGKKLGELMRTKRTRIKEELHLSDGHPDEPI